MGRGRRRHPGPRAHPEGRVGAKEAPTFIVDLQNVGEGKPHSLHIPSDCEIEMDGTWYYYNGLVDVTSKDTTLEPGKEYDDWVKVTPDSGWVEKAPKDKKPRPLLPLSPGKHTIRIAYPLNSEKPLLRPVSGAVEIEVGTESAWGKADDGVQARLRLVKAHDEGAAPTFALDLRNRGEHSHKAHRESRYCEIELDGKWYLHGGLDDDTKAHKQLA